MDPAAMVYHYGQTVFEGLKAYVTKDQEVLLFRPEKNMERLNQSNDRLCIPLIDEELVLEGLKQLVAIDQDWIPKAEGTSLYIRPFIIATEPFLGVAASHTYKLFIILSPVGSYYKEGIKPVKSPWKTNSCAPSKAAPEMRNGRQLRFKPEGAAGCGREGIFPGFMA